MIIRDNSGRAIGSLDTTADERRALFGAAGSAAGSGALPLFPRGIVRRAKRLCAYALVGAAALVLVGAIGNQRANEKAEATAPAVTTIGAPVAPYAVPAQQGSGRAPFLQQPSTVVLGNGAVLLNGAEVDNVSRADSPYRARYLSLIAPEFIGRESATVSEGISTCSALVDGSAVALREAADARSGVSEFGTGARRMALVGAALQVFCPRYN